MLLFCLLAFCLFPASKVESSDKIKIAIVGSGLSGASVSYFLTHLQNYTDCHAIDNVDPLSRLMQIDVFEQEKTVGGRTRSVVFENCTVNLGGSCFTPDQQFVKNYTKKFNISTSEHKAQKVTAVWNGTGFAFSFQNNANRMSLWFRMMAKYGLSSPLRTIYAVNKAMAKTRKLYTQILNDDDDGFLSIGEIARSAHIENLLNITLLEYLTQYHQVSVKFVDEMINPFLRDMFGGQHAGQVHAFAGLSALNLMLPTRKVASMAAGADVLTKAFLSGAQNALGSLFSIRAGDKVDKVIGEWHLCTLDQTQGSEKFRVVSDNSPCGTIYDLVVFATPLDSLPDFHYRRVRHMPDWSDFKRVPYSEIHLTLICGGQLSEKYFRRDGHSTKPLLASHIFTTDAHDLPFISIQMVQQSASGNIYKIFSVREIEHNVLSQVVTGRIAKVVRKKWKISPQMTMLDLSLPGKNRTRLPLIEPAQNLLITHAGEPLMVSMEAQMIFSFNVAKLIKRKVRNLVSQSTESDIRIVNEASILLKSVQSLFNPEFV